MMFEGDVGQRQTKTNTDTAEQHSQKHELKELLNIRQATLWNNKNKYFGYRESLNSCCIFVGRYVFVGQQVGHLLVHQHQFLLRSKHTESTNLCLITERKVTETVSSIYSREDRGIKTFNLGKKTLVFVFSCCMDSAVETHLSGNSMSSMVSGSGTPLVSGSSNTKPPARKAREPAHHSTRQSLLMISNIVHFTSKFIDIV